MEGQKIEWKWLASRIVLPIALVYVASFLYTLVKVRLLFYRLKKKGMPMLPWNPVLGNLPVLFNFMKKVPKDAQEAMSFALLASESGLDTCFYMDAWPFGFSTLVITSPDLAVQTCQTHDLSKPDALAAFITPMTGGPTFFDRNGAEWKYGRELFNHSFSMRSVMGYVPYILQEVEVYVDVLRDLAKTGDTFLLDEITCRYVMDIIGNVAMNTRFISQRKFHPIAAAMRDTIDRECQIETGNHFTRVNPVRLFKQWYNGRTMIHHIGIELEKRYQKWKQQGETSSSTSKSIMDLVITEYMKTRPVAGSTLDPKFKAWATIQIRLFLFVGHDSTAVTIMYCLYLLSKHPAALAKIRAEHDKIFSADLSNTSNLLRQRPELINQLPYTLAVIKETLRLFPPANGLRDGHSSVSLRDHQTGTTYPTAGFAIWIVHSAIHRNTHIWPDPHAFIPDRWLVDPGHPLYPPPGAWRPFEHGSRDCIGQTLALLDIRVTLLMTVREFDFQDQYTEWDRGHPAHGLNTIFGERAYMIQAGSGRPAQGLPCKVSLCRRFQPENGSGSKGKET
ncbi:putative N-alkane-inducible cytochrome P450 [Aspergillus coremiiformis]|uniref:Putative N-alkane-inducible cytochrome P450 n=1 Tax=Aspergillus coremiiformis TaxID=138285 RepID=A0A5N6YWB9_9EURO|nr:putative N-alkane-inducible cytochrome P450 [Aspergillus coremiiformis]